MIAFEHYKGERKMIKIFFLFVIFFPTVLMAQSIHIKVSNSDCQKLLSSSADYIPGVSVTGQQVAPADLNESGMFATTGQAVVPANIDESVSVPSFDLMTLTLPVSFDLGKNQSFWNSSLGFGDIPVAQVEMKDGQIFMNGRLIYGNDLATLKKACFQAVNGGSLDKIN